MGEASTEAPNLEALVLRYLAKSPGDPYSSAAELERALANCAAAGEWNADRARASWQLHGGAPTLAAEGHGVKATPE